MSDASAQDTFLTVAEVATRVRVNEQTVRNWIARGALPHVRVGRRVRIRQADFDRLVGLATPDTREANGEDSAESPSMPQAGARERFLGAAVDVATTMTRGRTDELAAALRVLARRAELWARALER